jgi:hypothetical protein
MFKKNIFMLSRSNAGSVGSRHAADTFAQIEGGCLQTRQM